MPLLSGHALLTQLRTGIRFLADGAMGTELITQGVAPSETLKANLSRTETVRSIHRQYLEAGAQILTSNTFGQCEDADWKISFLAGVRLAHEAALEGLTEIAVLVTVTAQTVRERGSQITALLNHAGFWPCNLLVETCVSLKEARVAAAILAELKPALLAVTCHFRANGCMPDGTSPATAARILAAAGAQIVGANCGDDPEIYPKVVTEMKAVTLSIYTPLLFRPSAGLPEQSPINGWRYPVTPEKFTGIAIRLKEAGANIVGGCCGTTPAHIAAVKQSLSFPQSSSSKFTP